MMLNANDDDSRTALYELEQFVSAIYRPNDIIEVRPIEIWTDKRTQRTRSRVLRQLRRWTTPAELLAARAELAWLNQQHRANVFMGVNPRSSSGGGTKSDVHDCRTLWADLDNVTPELVTERCEAAGVPEPSIVVGSGTGVHLYWLLRAVVDVSQVDTRNCLEATLKSLYRRLHCDATSDVSRLLRLPGFLNMKNVRNGRQPTPCRLVRCDSAKTFELVEFDFHESNRGNSTCVFSHSAQTPVSVDETDIRAILRRLDDTVPDRSRRDFAVVCSLLRNGLHPEEIRRLVANHSKFGSDGTAYLETTLRNALNAMGRSEGVFR